MRNKQQDMPPLHPSNVEGDKGVIKYVRKDVFIEKAVEWLAGACGAIIASVIFALITYLLFSIMENRYINIYLCQLLMLVNSAIIYPISLIKLMKLSFKIADNYNKKQKRKSYGNN